MSKTKKLTRLRKAAMNTVCAYCGHKTPSRYPGDVNREAIFAHVMECEKRPEARMAQHVLLCHAALKYARETINVLLAAEHSENTISDGLGCIADLDALLDGETEKQA